MILKDSKTSGTQEGSKEKKYTTPLPQMIDRVREEPKHRFIYSGIKESSVGFVFGPSKSGKTTYCEGLGLSIAAGLNEYLGQPIDIDNRKVVFISLEEFYSGRVERNTKQVEAIHKLVGSKSWVENYIVANDNMPRYLNTNEDWKIIHEVIKENNPGIVFIDSLSRMDEKLGDPGNDRNVMEKLRELANETKVAIVIIHHTYKLLPSTPLTINVMAGTRVIGQDADFVIGINRTFDGKRYIKDVAFRYKAEDDEKVKLFTIDENCCLYLTGEAYEIELLKISDGRYDPENKDRITQFFNTKLKEKCTDITYRELYGAFVSAGVMSKQTLSSALNSLTSEGKIRKVKRGIYSSVEQTE